MNYQVLIVDDEMLIREGLSRHIDWASLGMEVAGVADSADSALDIAERQSPDILVTDICMRGKNGFDLIEDLLEHGLAPQVILISSYNDFSYAQRAVRLDVVREYILKPVDTDHLTAILSKLRHELDLKHSTDMPLPENRILVGDYQDFLRTLRLNGYDRHLLMRHIKAGCLEKAYTVWSVAEKVILSRSGQRQLAERFCSNLLMTLISDGALATAHDANDPVAALCRCSDCVQLTGYMRTLIEQECATYHHYNHNAQSKLIAACLEIIERKFCNPSFNLTALAAELNVTPNYLSVRFKEEMGMGFMKFLLDKQIERAKLLLADPSYKVYEISNMVGFQDEKYFSRQFKKITGLTPKEYRNTQTSPL